MTMPRRSALLIHDQSSAIAGDEAPSGGADTVEAHEGVIALPWLFPWLLAVTGILITLALMR